MSACSKTVNVFFPKENTACVLFFLFRSQAYSERPRPNVQELILIFGCLSRQCVQAEMRAQRLARSQLKTRSSSMKQSTFSSAFKIKQNMKY